MTLNRAHLYYKTQNNKFTDGVFLHPVKSSLGNISPGDEICCSTVLNTISYSSRLELFKSIIDGELKESNEYGKARGYPPKVIGNVASDLMYVAHCFAKGQMPTTNTLTTQLSSRISVLVARAMAKLFLYNSEYDVPNFMKVGTKFQNITNLDKSGRANPINGGYLTLESLDEIRNYVKANPECKDGKAWLQLAESNIIKPRVGTPEANYISQFLLYLTMDSCSVMCLEASAIILALTDASLNHMWAPQYDRYVSIRVNVLASRAPVMMGAYFYDMLTADVHRRTGNQNRIPQVTWIRARRWMLQNGYFTSILKLKKLQHLAVKNRPDENIFYDALSTTATCGIDGVSKKKAISVIADSDKIDSDMAFVKDFGYDVHTKGIDSTSVIEMIHNDAQLGASGAYIWTDQAIVVLTSQWSRVGNLPTIYTRKEEDALTGQTLAYHPIDSLAGTCLDNLLSGIVPKSDLESRYYNNLTTKSPGTIPPDVDNLLRNLPPSIRAMRSQKVVVAAVAPQILTNPSLVLETIRSDMTAGSRQQINRRPRVVVAVSMPSNLAYEPGNEAGKDFKYTSKFYGAGTNTGTMSDVKEMLHGTGSTYLANSFTDVVSFDSSTPLDNQRYQETKIGEAYASYDNIARRPGYFAFQGRTRTIKVFDVQGKYLYTTMKKYSSVQECIFAVTERTPRLRIKDDRYIATSSSTLDSGKFSTTQEATSDTSAGVEATALRLKDQFAEGKTAGDDIRAVFTIDPIDPLPKMMEFDQILSEELGSLGYKVESNMSTYYCEFLQNPALFGSFGSAATRLSPYTAERHGLEHHFLGVQSAVGMFFEMIGRAYCPDSLLPIMWSFAYVMSTIVVPSDFPDKVKSAYGKVAFVTIPLLGMLMKFNIPFPGLERHGVPTSSIMSLGGDGVFLQLYRYLVREPSKYEEIQFTGRQYLSINKRLARAQMTPSDIVRRREAQLNMYEDGVIFQHILDRFRQDVLVDFEVKRSLIYFNTNPTVDPSKDTIPEMDRMVLEQFSKNLNSLNDPARLAKSALAVKTLEYKYGLGNLIPDVLNVEKRAYHRLETGYMQSRKSNDYWQGTDTVLARQFINNSKKSLWSMLKDKFIICSIGIDSDKDRSINDPVLEQAIMTIPPTPPTMYSLQSRLALFRTGLYNDDHQRDINRLDKNTATTFLETNIDAWNRIINTISRFGPQAPDLIQLVAEATGLSQEDQRILTSIIVNGATFMPGLLHITVNAKSRPWLSLDSRQTLMRIAPLSSQRFLLKRRVLSDTVAAMVVLYDSIYGPSHGKSTYSVNVPPYVEAYILSARK